MNQGKSKAPICTIVMYVGAIIVALSAIAYLVNSVLIYKNSVSQYVAQGYQVSEVTAQLIPNQLLPCVFQAIIFLGIALILWGAGVINQKISLCCKALIPEEVSPVNIDPLEQTDVVAEAPEENITEPKQN